MITTRVRDMNLDIQYIYIYINIHEVSIYMMILCRYDDRMHAV